jgi:hypothetical protein
MTRIIIACSFALWAGPIAAQELHLDPPTLSARADRCAPAQRALCEGIDGRRAIETDLSCDACAPLPPEKIAPPSATRLNASPACLPGAAEPQPKSCTPPPPIDTIPRP